MFTNVIHNKESVEALGKDYGVKGADGTGPWCFDSWQPRTQIVLRRHDAYRWGPSMYKNKGPVKFEKLVIKIVPEDSSRVAAMMAGQFDTTHQFPQQFIAQAKTAPMLTVTQAKPNFQLLYFGFKTSRPMVADKRVREAMSIAINRAEIAKAILLGNADPAFTFVDPTALDFAESTRKHGQGGRRARQEAAGRGRLEARRRRRAREGRRQAACPRSTTPRPATRRASPRPSRATCADRRALAAPALGLDHRAAKMAEQDYEIWSVTVPYLSAGDLMNIYFDSRNIPTPNRMNWKDAETDEWLRLGRAALSDAERFKYYELVQKKVTARGALDARAQHQHVRGHQQEDEGHAPAHDLPEHFLQGTGREFLTIRHPDRSRAKRGAAEGPILNVLSQDEVPRLRRPLGGFARDDGIGGNDDA